MYANRHAATVFEEKENVRVRIDSLPRKSTAMLAQVQLLADLTCSSFRCRWCRVSFNNTGECEGCTFDR